MHRPVFVGGIEGLDRADFRLRIQRRTDARAQIHQRLIEVAWSLRVDQFPHDRFKNFPAGWFGDVGIDFEQPAHDAHDVSVDCRLRYLESDAGDGACCIRSDALQLSDFLRILRENTIVIGDDLLRRFLHVLDTRIITQPFPRLQDRVFRRCRQRCDVREFIQEIMIIRDDRIHPCLLQHDFRNPDAVGIARPAPRQIAFLFVVPVQQRFAESLYFLGRPHFDAGCFEYFCMFRICHYSASCSFSSI